MSVPSFRIRTRMSARDTGEKHRVSSPIELLFDLTFVVAISQVAGELAKHINEGKTASAIVPFLMVFFAIWWAWINFTWFASAYDTDDVPYRLLTLLQMGGVLVLAAGVPLAFGENNFFLITLGYFIMRIGLISQWIRAAMANPDARATPIRYAVIISVVQALWLIRAALPATPETIPYTVFLAFPLLAALEILTPFIAERTAETTWHPHHIAERYGLFAIILLGESIAALAGSIQRIISNGNAAAPLVTVGICSLLLVFALWWLYFMPPTGDGLEEHRERSFLWGYGHYFVFVGLAALGGSLEVVTDAVAGHEVPATLATYAVGIPVAVYLIAFWATQFTVLRSNVIPLAAIVPAAVAELLLPLTAENLGLPLCYALMTAVVVLLLAIVVIRKDRHLRQLAEVDEGRV